MEIRRTIDDYVKSIEDMARSFLSEAYCMGYKEGFNEPQKLNVSNELAEKIRENAYNEGFAEGQRNRNKENMTVWDLNKGEIIFPTNDKNTLDIAYYASFWSIRHDILLKLYELRDKHVKSLTIQEIIDLIMKIPPER